MTELTPPPPTTWLKRIFALAVTCSTLLSIVVALLYFAVRFKWLSEHVIPTQVHEILNLGPHFISVIVFCCIVAAMLFAIFNLRRQLIKLTKEFWSEVRKCLGYDD